MPNSMMKKHKNLLMNSLIIEEYPLLKNILLESHSLGNLRIDMITKIINESRDITYSNILDKAINEWIVDESSFEYLEENTIQCQICGKRMIKNVYQIENIFTKKDLR